MFTSKMILSLRHVLFISVQSLSRVQLFATPWIAARQASLSITNSRSLLKLMSIESVMPSSHLILCCPLLLLPPTPPSIRVFSNESTLHMRWPKYWSFTLAPPQMAIPWHLRKETSLSSQTACLRKTNEQGHSCVCIPATIIPLPQWKFSLGSSPSPHFLPFFT